MSFGESVTRIEALNEAGALPGDIVELLTPDRTAISRAGWVFALPVAAGLAGYIAGWNIFRDSIPSYITSAILFFGAVAAVFLIFNRIAKKNRPVIKAIID